MSLLPKKIIGLDFSFIKYWLGFFLQEFSGGLLGSSYSRNYWWGLGVFYWRNPCRSRVFFKGIFSGYNFFPQRNSWQVGFLLVEFLVGFVDLVCCCCCKKYNIFLTLLKNLQCRPYNDRIVFACRSFLDSKSLVIQFIIQEIALVKNPLTQEIFFHSTKSQLDYMHQFKRWHQINSLLASLKVGKDNFEQVKR